MDPADPADGHRHRHRLDHPRHRRGHDERDPRAGAREPPLEQLQHDRSASRSPAGPAAGSRAPTSTPRRSWSPPRSSAGFLLVVESRLTPASGAYVEDDARSRADRRAAEALADDLDGARPGHRQIDGVGSYSCAPTGREPVAVVGLAAHRGGADHRPHAHDDRPPHRGWAARAGRGHGPRHPGRPPAPPRRRRHRHARRQHADGSGRRVDLRARSGRPGGCPHRDRAGGRRPQHPARSRRCVARRPPAQRGADAAIRRRREPRAAHSPGVDPRILGALAARHDAQRDERVRHSSASRRSRSA